MLQAPVPEARGSSNLTAMNHRRASVRISMSPSVRDRAHASVIILMYEVLSRKIIFERTRACIQVQIISLHDSFGGIGQQRRQKQFSAQMLHAT